MHAPSPPSSAGPLVPLLLGLRGSFKPSPLGPLGPCRSSIWAPLDTLWAPVALPLGRSPWAPRLAHAYSTLGWSLRFAFLARAARMLQTASGDDPKIAQNSNTSKIASGRPRIAPRRLQDGQDAQTDPNRTPQKTPNKPLNRRNDKVKCNMMNVQKILKTLCQTHILDMQNIVCSSLSAS